MKKIQNIQIPEYSVAVNEAEVAAVAGRVEFGVVEKVVVGVGIAVAVFAAVKEVAGQMEFEKQMRLGAFVVET